MTTSENGIFTEGQFVAHLRAKGIKPSKAAISIDKLMPQRKG